MKTLTLDQFAQLLWFAAEAKGDKTAMAVATEAQEWEDTTAKLYVLNVLAVQLEVAQ